MKVILFSMLLSATAPFGEVDASSPSFAQDTGGIRTIDIITPAWKDSTNQDGTGLFFEIVRKVYEPIGIKMTYRIIPWKRAERMVIANQADAMLCVFLYNVNKMRLLAPEHPMFVDYTAAVFKKDKIREWNGVETLRGKRVIWIRGYDFHKNPLLKDLGLKWDEIDMHAQGWKMLEKDRTEVYMDSVSDLQGYARDQKVNMAPYRMETLWGENTYMAFATSEKSRQLIKIYDRRIMELFKSGELKKIFDKWNLYSFPAGAWKEE